MPRFRIARPLAALVLILSLGSFSHGNPYQEISIRLRPGQDARGFLQEQQERNPDLEVSGQDEGGIRAVSRPEITDDLLAQGYTITMIHPDLEAFYAARQGKVSDYGVWHTYAEMYAAIDSLHLRFPEITTEPFSIGQSLQGREIWAIKVSDHPDQDEPEPEVLFDGNHHAREIMTVELCLYLIRYLCENYGLDPLATQLVQEREIYFVPIVNPDGFVYNEMKAPNGGGMWRKNRRPGDSCDGIDLNRNFPIGWGGAGASRDPCAETYCGPSPASEPETQAMIRFINSRRFVTHDSIHSYQGSILHPWGYTAVPTEDAELFVLIATGRASENGYSIGRLGVSGCTSDFAYGDRTTRPKILSFLTEIGGSGFWPAPHEKEGLLRENLHSMLYLAQVAGVSMKTESLSLVSDPGERRVEAGETIELVSRVINESVLETAPAVRARLGCDDPYVQLLAVSDSVGGLPSGAVWENKQHPYRCRIDERCPGGRRVTFSVAVDAGNYTHRETPFTFQVGSIPALYACDFEEDEGGWVTGAGQTATAGSFVRCDPNPTGFQPDDDATPEPGRYAFITGQNSSDGDEDVDGGVAEAQSPILDLSAAAHVQLSMDYFCGQRNPGDDPGEDWFRLDVSSDAGTSWVNLVEIGDQHVSAEWRNLTVDLENVIDLTNRVQLRVQASDGPDRGDVIEAGIDNVVVARSVMNSLPPSAPEVVSPADLARVPPRTTLTVGNARDPEGDPLRYGFRVFADSGLTRLVRAGDNVLEGTEGRTSWSVPIPLDPGTYYWRAYAADAGQWGRYSPVSSFAVNSVVPTEELAAVHADPNPSSRTCRILYFLPRALTSRVSVFDAQGREVRRLPGTPSASGWQLVDWDARDDEGHRVPAGIYWVRVWTPAETRTARIVRIE